MSMFMESITQTWLSFFPFQRVKDEVQRRQMQCISCHERQDDELRFTKPAGHAQFHASLDTSKLTPACVVPECPWDLPSASPFSVSDD